MAEINLSKYGITGTTEIVHNPSYEKLFEEETKAGLEGYEVGQETELGAVNVMTGLQKTNISLWTRTQRTLYGGHLMSTRTTTTQ